MWESILTKSVFLEPVVPVTIYHWRCSYSVIYFSYKFTEIYEITTKMLSKT